MQFYFKQLDINLYSVISKHYFTIESVLQATGCVMADQVIDKKINKLYQSARGTIQTQLHNKMKKKSVQMTNVIMQSATKFFHNNWRKR